MEIRHCPMCGSDDITKNSSSFEYGGSTRWSCDNCDWYYKKGRGIGTGTGNAGTHPRKARSSSAQKQLVETGSWCSNCEVCAKSGRCGCVEDSQTGFCKKCAEFSEHRIDEMLEVNSYSGRYNGRETFDCSICAEKNAEYKIVE